MANEGCKTWSEQAAQGNDWLEKNICTAAGGVSDETHEGTGGKITVYRFGKMLSTQDYDALSKKVRVTLVGGAQSAEAYGESGKTLKLHRIG